MVLYVYQLLIFYVHCMEFAQQQFLKWKGATCLPVLDDDSRVHVSGFNTDYINANYIDVRNAM